MKPSISSFPKVSVLIPLYNAEPYITETIESVLAQTYPHIEMVIVDDGSSDGSYAIAQAYAKRHQNILLVKQKNRGPGATRNCAFNLSTGDYIQYLDADDLLAPDKIALQMALLTDYGDKSLIFGSVATFYNDIDTSTFLNFPYFKNYDNSLNFLIDYWGEGGMIAISSLLIPRTTVTQAGRWNERWILNEDGEFISRVIQKMQRVIYLEESISYYRKENPKSLNSQRSYQHYHAQLHAYYAYEQLLENHFSKSRNLAFALAKRYARFICHIYPNHPNLRQDALRAIHRLGFHKPPPVGSPLFITLSKYLGVSNTLFLQQLLHTLRKGLS